MSRGGIVFDLGPPGGVLIAEWAVPPLRGSEEPNEINSGCFPAYNPRGREVDCQNKDVEFLKGESWNYGWRKRKIT